MRTGKRKEYTMAKMIDEIKQALANRNGKWNEKKGVWEFSTIIAERKAFLAKKKLTYSARMRIDDSTRAVKYSEMLVETGSGLSTGGYDDGISGGFGFKTESYNTFGGARQGTIEEQSSIFGKDYQYAFDYSEIRMKIKAIAERAGYRFEYQLLPVT
jgi:hypothetical protein